MKDVDVIAHTTDTECFVVRQISIEHFISLCFLNSSRSAKTLYSNLAAVTGLMERPCQIKFIIRDDLPTRKTSKSREEQCQNCKGQSLASNERPETDRHDDNFARKFTGNGVPSVAKKECRRRYLQCSLERRWLSAAGTQRGNRSIVKNEDGRAKPSKQEGGFMAKRG
jgi:hypothetical protein